MVRTYWLVQVFNEASWNLDLQPDRTDDQVESNFGPVLCQRPMVASDDPAWPTRALADLDSGLASDWRLSP
jgi:hypothetical protein